jgi:hypothetical protein
MFPVMSTIIAHVNGGLPGVAVIHAPQIESAAVLRVPRSPPLRSRSIGRGIGTGRCRRKRKEEKREEGGSGVLSVWRFGGRSSGAVTILGLAAASGHAPWTPELPDARIDRRSVCDATL